MAQRLPSLVHIARRAPIRHYKDAARTGTGRACVTARRSRPLVLSGIPQTRFGRRRRRAAIRLSPSIPLHAPAARRGSDLDTFSLAPPGSPDASGLPDRRRSRRMRSTTLTIGRSRNQLTIASVTTTISTNQRKNPQEAPLPHSDSFIPDITGGRPTIYHCAFKTVAVVDGLRLFEPLRIGIVSEGVDHRSLLNGLLDHSVSRPSTLPGPEQASKTYHGLIQGQPEHTGVAPHERGQSWEDEGIAGLKCSAHSAAGSLPSIGHGALSSTRSVCL